MMEQIAFYTFAAITLGAALGVVMLRNVLHSALMLGLCLFGVAGLFASLNADFIFAAQILIYVGGIAVLILFVVLLAGRAKDLMSRQVNAEWPAGVLICGVILWGLWYFIKSYRQITASAPAAPTTAALGRMLLGDLAVPFEVISLILLAALAGAIVFSKTESDS